ncbi:MAG: MurT ligase domain-containing protein [Acidimicrobiales bacterium]
MRNDLSLRDHVAIGTVRLVNLASRVLKRGSGTVAGGQIGLLVSPEVLKNLARGRQTVLVSGTNGKTTTTAMVGAGWGGEVATNDTGANMLAGHVAALVGSASEHAVLEVDEAWLADAVSSIEPVVVVLLNLSRDQLDRASEVRQMAERWRKCLAGPGGETRVVVANANDPLVVFAASDAPRVLWCDVPTDWQADARSCPRCTRALVRAGTSWHCVCGFAKPTTLGVTLRNGLVIHGREVPLELSLPGHFNEANAAMALAALNEVGVDPVVAVSRINAVRGVAGRFTRRQWHGHTLELLLAKNPSGFDALISTVQDGHQDLWIAINARIADGRDPSWLYDVPFERLRGHRVWCLGERRLDLAARLEYGGVDFEVVDDPDLIPISPSSTALLANYTAFSEWLERSDSC